MYFFYERNPFGAWVPVKTAEAPTDKRTDGSKARSFTTPVKLSSPEDGFDLESLMHIYPQAVEAA